MRTTDQVYHLDRSTAEVLLDKLPRHIREAFYARAAEIDYPIAAVLDSAIVVSLDPDALSFIDCQLE